MIKFLGDTTWALNVNARRCVLQSVGKINLRDDSPLHYFGSISRSRVVSFLLAPRLALVSGPSSRLNCKVIGLDPVKLSC